MLRTADHYIGQLIEFYKLYDKNTLVFITGNHGMHDETVLKQGGEQVNDNLKMNSEYQFKHVGGDIMFDVSAVVADLDDGRLIKALGLDPHSVIQAPFDHDDLVVSLFDMVSRFQPR